MGIDGFPIIEMVVVKAIALGAPCLDLPVSPRGTIASPAIDIGRAAALCADTLELRMLPAAQHVFSVDIPMIDTGTMCSRVEMEVLYSDYIHSLFFMI